MNIGKYAIDSVNLADSYEAIKELPDNCLDCIYTDIPYLFKVTKSKNGNNELDKSIRKKRNEIMEISNGIHYGILDEFVRVMKKVNIFIWCSRSQVCKIMQYFENMGCVAEILVWCKTNPQPAIHNTWLPDVEYCLYFREQGVALNDGYEIKSKWYSSPINVRDKAKFLHPTCKPVELIKRHLLHATNKGDIVGDFFCGSGSTCIACIDTERHYLAFDNNPKWVNIAINRTSGIDANGVQSLWAV